MKKQFAYMQREIVHGKHQFSRMKGEINTNEQMNRCVARIPHIAAYESVYSFDEWNDGRPDPKSAIIDRVFLDFDDADNPQRAMIDAAEVAAFVGHTEQWFSGKKGIGMLIHCEPVPLIDEMKSVVIRRFVNDLSDRLPEVDTLDFAVVGDTNRVHRIIDTRHQSTRSYAIGLHQRELLELSIDDVREMAASPRRLVQNTAPSKWVTERLMQIEEDVLMSRINRLRDDKMIGFDNAVVARLAVVDAHRRKAYDFIEAVDAEYRRIQRLHVKESDSIVGRTPEETWLLQVVDIFKQVHRAANIQPRNSRVSTSSSEHEARCHIASLGHDCGYSDGEIADMFSGADDYNRPLTMRMIKSLTGRRR